MKLRFKLLYSLAALLTSISLLQGAASAAFIKSRVMDDAVFDNYNTMSAAEIDTFLNSSANNASCISTKNGFTSPDVMGYNPSQGFLYGNNVSAGTIIYHAAQAYEVNPRVILSTLQKEQSLVTGGAGCDANYQGDAPQFFSWSKLEACSGNGNPYPDCGAVTCGGSTTYSDCSYACRHSGGGCTQVAVGYDCPGFCKKSSAGFSKQVIKATWSLKFSEQRSRGNSNFNIQKPGWDNSDDPATSYSGPMTQGTFRRCNSCSLTYFDGYTSIEGETVHMDSGATVALYRYTPFFSGNQHFVSIYESWFGSTTLSYSWKNNGYKFFLKDGTTPADSGHLVPGEHYIAKLTAENNGNATWQKDGPAPINLAASNPTSRSSVLCINKWLACNRPTYLDEQTVSPGQTGHFTFEFQAPYVSGRYDEYFKPVAENFQWFNDTNEGIGINVNYHGTFAWQNFGYRVKSQDGSTYLDPGNLRPNTTYIAILSAKNVGTASWFKNNPTPMHLGTANPTGRNSILCDSSTWVSCSRPAVMTEDDVPVGQMAHFQFYFKTPSNTGSYREYFKPLAEMYSWTNDTDEPLGIIVK